MSTINRSHDPGRVVLMMKFSSPSASRRLAAITMNHANGRGYFGGFTSST